MFVINNLLWMVFLYTMLPSQAKKRDIKIPKINLKKILGKEAPNVDFSFNNMQPLEETSLTEVVKSIQGNRKH